MLIRRMLVLALLLLLAVPAGGQKKKRKTRDMLVREDRQEFRESDYWIYNDLPRGLAEAKRSGKPLLVVLRCIP